MQRAGLCLGAAHRPLRVVAGSMGIGRASGAEPPRALWLAAVAGVGVATGIGALAAGSADPRVAVALVLAASAPFVLVVVARLERVLIGLLILDIPLQWDVYLGYKEVEGELGAIAGLNLSLTTFALACLYAIWAAELLSRARPCQAAIAGGSSTDRVSRAQHRIGARCLGYDALLVLRCPAGAAAARVYLLREQNSHSRSAAVRSRHVAREPADRGPRDRRRAHGRSELRGAWPL